MCALNFGCDHPCRCVTDWWKGSKLHRANFQTQWWLFTTRRALGFSSDVSGRSSWHTTSLQKKWPEGQEVSTSQGLFPAWWSYRHPHALTKHSHKWEPHGPNWDLCVCADAWQPRQRRLSGVSALLADLLTTFFPFGLFGACRPPLGRRRR